MTKILSLEQAPRRLVLHLKRFQFDQKSHNSIKIQTRVSFPSLLHIPSTCLSQDLQSKLRSKATQQHATVNNIPVSVPIETVTKPLTKNQKAKARRKKNAEMNNPTSNSSASSVQHIPGLAVKPPLTITPTEKHPSPLVSTCLDVQYLLQSVVLHHGTSAHSGHYTCLVRRRKCSAAGDEKDRCEWVHIDDKNVSIVTENYVFESIQSQVRVDSCCRILL